MSTQKTIWRWKKLLTTKPCCIYNSFCFSISLEILLIDLLITKLQQRFVGFLLLSFAIKISKVTKLWKSPQMTPQALFNVDCEGNVEKQRVEEKKFACFKNVATARAENEESPRSESRRKQIKRILFLSSWKTRKFPDFRSFSSTVWLGDSSSRMTTRDCSWIEVDWCMPASKHCVNSPKHPGHCPNSLFRDPLWQCSDRQQFFFAFTGVFHSRTVEKIESQLCR